MAQVTESPPSKDSASPTAQIQQVQQSQQLQHDGGDSDTDDDGNDDKDAASSWTSYFGSVSRSAGKRFFHTASTGIWIASKLKRYELDVGEADEPFYNNPDGPTYEYEDALVDGPVERIRILEVLPGQPKDDIICKLKTVELNNTVVYETLSYYWGDDKPDHSIRIVPEDYQDDLDEAAEPDQQHDSNDNDTQLDSPGYIFHLQSNIRSALRHVRLLDCSRHVWADAVCINQENLDERNSQVSMMHRIYSSATRTLIWLGKSGFGSDQLFEQLRRTVAALNNDALIGTDTGEPVLTDSQMQGTPALTRLIQRHWFNRLWTVQEVLLARDAQILCGWQSMPWTDFVQAVHYVYDRALAPGRRLELLDQGRFDTFLMLSSGSLDTAHGSNQNPYERLVNLLLALRPRESSDPSDKVFGLTGLVTTDDGKQIIRPDYHLDYDQVYAMATRLVITKTGSLDILGASGSTALLDAHAQPVPSWVADFVHRGRPTRAFRFMYDPKLRPPNDELKPEQGEIRFEGDKLWVKVIFIDEITDVAPVLTDYDLTKTKKTIHDRIAKAAEMETNMREADTASAVAEEAASGLLTPETTTSGETSLVDRFRTSARALKTQWQVAGTVAGANLAANIIDLQSTAGWYVHSIKVFLDWEDFAGLASRTPSIVRTEQDTQDPSTPAPSKKTTRTSPAEEVAAERKTPQREEYWQTIAGGSLLPEGQEYSRQAFEQFSDMLDASRKLHKHGITGHGGSVKHVLAIGAYLAGQFSIGSPFPRLLAHAQGRRLAKTASGRLALVAEESKPGDKLAYCKGARVPLLFRNGSDKNDDRQAFRFVGESYGHAFADVKLEAAKWESIVIT